MVFQDCDFLEDERTAGLNVTIVKKMKNIVSFYITSLNDYISEQQTI